MTTPTPTPVPSPAAPTEPTPTTRLMSPLDIQWKQSPSFTRPDYSIYFLINGIGMVKTAITFNGVEMITQEHFVDLTAFTTAPIMDMADAFLNGSKDPLTTGSVTQTSLDIFNYVKSQKSSVAFTTSTWAVVAPGDSPNPI